MGQNNLIGQYFGHLKVIRDTNERVKGVVMYECECECGNTVLASSIQLRGHKIKTCKDCYLSRTYRGEESNYEGYVVLVRDDCNEGIIYLGKKENFYATKHYKNDDNSLIEVSSNKKIGSFLTSSGFLYSQQEMIEKGIFKASDYEEFDNLQKTILCGLTPKRELKFSVNIKQKNSGVPFTYPDWEGKKAKKKTTNQ